MEEIFEALCNENPAKFIPVIFRQVPAPTYIIEDKKVKKRTKRGKKPIKFKSIVEDQKSDDNTQPKKRITGIKRKRSSSFREENTNLPFKKRFKSGSSNQSLSRKIGGINKDTIM